MTPFATSILVIVLTLAIIAFDVYLATDGKKGNTYSERIRLWGKRWSWFPYTLSLALGVLCGHWFL